MELKTLARRTNIPLLNPRRLINQSLTPSSLLKRRYSNETISRSPLRFSLSFRKRNQFVAACIVPSHEVIEGESEVFVVNDENEACVSSIDVDERGNAGIEVELAGNESIWEQMVEIVKFSGPATGLWLCGPLMSLIDTAVIGQSSSIELAALGVH